MFLKSATRSFSSLIHSSRNIKIRNGNFKYFSTQPPKDENKNEDADDFDKDYEPKKKKSNLLLIETTVTALFLAGLSYAGWKAYKYYEEKKETPLDWIKGIISGYQKPISEKLLDDHPADMIPSMIRPTLVINLDDLLIYRSYDGQTGWKTQKRRGVEEFLNELSSYWEIVVFSDSYMMSAMPIIEKIDNQGRIAKSLFREASLYESGKVIKDLSKLNRPLSRVVIVEWQKDAISKQPENAIIVPRWTGDTKDTLLTDMIPVLKHLSALKDDYREILKNYESHDAKVIVDKYAKLRQNSKDSSSGAGSSFWDYIGLGSKK